MLLVVLRANGGLACIGFGSGRVDFVGPLTLIEGTEGETDMEGALTCDLRGGAAGSFTLIVGTEGVTDMEGALTLDPCDDTGDSLTDIVGMDGVTDIEGAFTRAPPPRGPLTEIDGVSWIAIVGMGGAGDD